MFKIIVTALGFIFLSGILAMIDAAVLSVTRAESLGNSKSLFRGQKRGGRDPSFVLLLLSPLPPHMATPRLPSTLQYLQGIP